MVYSGTPLKQGPKILSFTSKVSLAQGLVVDHVPPTVMANHDKAVTKDDEKTVLIGDLLISLRQESGHNLGIIATTGRWY